MSESVSLAAEKRERVGKGGARATRRAGRVPAIIYGGQQDPVAISLDPTELHKQLRGPGFFSRVFELNVAGQKHRVLARDLQHHPINGRPLHVDFMRFSATTMVDVDIEVVFENEEECPGLKKGGVLNVVQHSISVSCLAGQIPQSIAIDLSGLDIGDGIHLKDIALPEGVKPTTDDMEAAIVIVAAPTVAAAEEEEEGEEEGTAVASETGSSED
ncbi:MAG: 50S ribosomal protein L25/general stress protein Ctc [Rhodospirillales bacterium]|nr:50S ribosomal protein L25/general stress protein Ctc [Rhodospirillales bacterium]